MSASRGKEAPEGVGGTAGCRRRAVRAIAFDFDGVLLETVEVKTRAFAQLFGGEGPEMVRRVIEYHLSHGGVSRVEKLRVIYRDILNRPLDDEDLERLSEQFHAFVFEQVVAAPWVRGAEEFLRRFYGTYAFFVISGTPDGELKDIVRRRRMERWFDDIWGSPETKEELLARCLSEHELSAEEVVFVGDAETDWAAAQHTGVRFIWRRASLEAAPLPGFDGAVITTLEELSGCLGPRAMATERAP